MIFQLLTYIRWQDRSWLAVVSSVHGLALGERIGWPVLLYTVTRHVGAPRLYTSMTYVSDEDQFHESLALGSLPLPLRFPDVPPRALRSYAPLVDRALKQRTMAPLLNVKTMFLRCGTLIPSHSPATHRSAENSSLDLSRRAQHCENAYRQHGAAIMCSSKKKLARPVRQCFTHLEFVNVVCAMLKKTWYHSTHHCNCLVNPSLQVDLGRSDHLLTAPRTPLYEDMSCESPGEELSSTVASPPLSFTTSSQRLANAVSGSLRDTATSAFKTLQVTNKAIEYPLELPCLTGTTCAASCCVPQSFAPMAGAWSRRTGFLKK